MSDVRLTLIGKPGCHLCDDARAVIHGVLGSEPIREANVHATVIELNILEDEELRALYGEEIPVVLIDGKQHSFWHVDPARLTRALLERQ